MLITRLPARRSVWLPYAGLCFLAWVLYAAAGADWRHGDWRLASALYEATWNLGDDFFQFDDPTNISGSFDDDGSVYAEQSSGSGEGVTGV